jgi:hypothetical protein
MRRVEGGLLRIDVSTISNYNDIRRSIRINTTDTFNEGLFIARIQHIPQGMGVWPAFWLTGASLRGSGRWACEGEIDIIEGVNSINYRTSFITTSLHTSNVNGNACDQSGTVGQTIGKPNEEGNPITNNGVCNFGRDGGVAHQDFKCGCSGTEQCPYSGCGVKSKYPASFGFGFNKNGGGVYACELTKDGYITVWFFPNGDIPCDIESNTPDPSSWDDYIAVKFSKACPGHFKDMHLIFNTTLCGDWSGSAFDDGTGLKQLQGSSYDPSANCKAIIQDPNNKMSDAHWLINYVKIFQKNSS